ncbi:MAG: aminotransferase class III-fold pyridoxal phosphate-dependent enzyme [Magnetococcales bacterium]|nr:aminotransferase class III-fold pyridoxal phosphate-dependent enzyme [Magnetococcales bacterium]
MDSRYHRSNALLTRALSTIPLASQTFSKSIVQYPRGVSPLFLTRGKGCRVWDADGHEYIDFVSGLLSLTLGYGDPDVDAAVRRQLDSGVIFSLPHPLEMEVAERLTQMVPCAEMVRFGKNGSDATAGAVRLARAYTGRDHVAVCGYHGWQDWYIGSTSRNLGVPKATQALTHPFVYNNPGSLQQLLAAHPGEVAAVILEPTNVTAPAPGFLEQVKELTHAAGAVLIFDETITGFRFANGGAQELYGVVPDLATLGKGLANGYPLSAVVGRREIMQHMEEIFFSFTFGGETLSLAAAAAVLDKLRREPVVATLWEKGRRLQTAVRAAIARHNVGHFLSLAGQPVWSLLLVADQPSCTQWEIKSLFMQELFSRGILAFGSHNLNYAHGDAELNRLVQVYDEVFPILKRAVDEGEMANLLRCEPIQPVFRVR